MLNKLWCMFFKSRQLYQLYKVCCVLCLRYTFTDNPCACVLVMFTAVVQLVCVRYISYISISFSFSIFFKLDDPTWTQQIIKKVSFIIVCMYTVVNAKVFENIVTFEIEYGKFHSIIQRHLFQLMGNDTSTHRRNCMTTRQYLFFVCPKILRSTIPKYFTIWMFLTLSS